MLNCQPERIHSMCTSAGCNDWPVRRLNRNNVNGPCPMNHTPVQSADIGDGIDVVAAAAAAAVVVDVELAAVTVVSLAGLWNDGDADGESMLLARHVTGISDGGVFPWILFRGACVCGDVPCGGELFGELAHSAYRSKDWLNRRRPN